MMKTKVLVDTSILVEYFRGKNLEIIDLVKELIINHRIVLCGIVFSELLAGVRTRNDQEIIEQAIDALDYAEVSRSIWIMAGEMASKLRQQGIKPPHMTYLIIAAIAIENSYELLTKDSHFDKIPELKRLLQSKT